MHQSIINEGSRYKVINQFHADRPMLKEPPLIGVVTIDGVLYYKGKYGKIYIPELFDRMFKVKK